MQHDPGGRPDLGKTLGVARIASIAAEPNGGWGAQGFMGRTRPVDYGDWYAGGDVAEASPAMKLGEIVGAHQPDKAHTGAAASQISDDVGGEASADIGFKSRYADARIGSHASRPRQSRIHVRQVR